MAQNEVQQLILDRRPKNEIMTTLVQSKKFSWAGGRILFLSKYQVHFFFAVQTLVIAQ